MPSPNSQKTTLLSDLLFLAPLALFFILYDLGNGSLASWDEAIYATVAREIVRSGDWLRPTFGGVVWLDKPPLAIWATAFFYKIWGVHEWTARFFSALCGIGTVMITYFFGRSIFNRWTGLCGALVLLSSSHFLRLARFGTMDTAFLFLMTLSLYLFWLGREKSRYLFLSGIATGLAAMTKSFAVFFIFLILAATIVLSGRWALLRRRSCWAGLAAAFLIVAPWNVYEFIFFRQDFWTTVTRNLVHRTASAIEGHTGNSYYYIRVLINKYHPWILVGIFSGPYFLWRAVRRREEGVIFLTIWIFSVLAIITLTQTKLQWYILPLYPALSLCVADSFVRIFKEQRHYYAKALFVAVLLVHAGYSHIWRTDYSDPIKNLAPVVTKTAPPGSVVYFYRYHEQPAGIFYLEREVRYLETPVEFEACAAKEGFYCLIRGRDRAEIADIFSKYGISASGYFNDIFFLHGPSLIKNR